MIDNWQESGSLIGATAIIIGGIVKIFSGNGKRGTEVLDALLKNQTDQTRILDRLSLLIEHWDTRTEELHKDTHKKIEESNNSYSRKLDEITDNQRDIICTIERGIDRMRTA